MASVWQSVLASDGRVQSLSRSHCVLELELLCLVVMDSAARLSAGAQLFLLFTWVVKEKYRLLNPFFFSLHKTYSLVCSHTNHTPGGKLHLAGVAEGL